MKVIFAENDAITQSTQLSKAIQVEARCRKWPKQR
jgi:hypothetical protein